MINESGVTKKRGVKSKLAKNDLVKIRFNYDHEKKIFDPVTKKEKVFDYHVWLKKKQEMHKLIEEFGMENVILNNFDNSLYKAGEVVTMSRAEAEMYLRESKIETYPDFGGATSFKINNKESLEATRRFLYRCELVEE